MRTEQAPAKETHGSSGTTPETPTHTEPIRLHPPPGGAAAAWREAQDGLLEELQAGLEGPEQMLEGLLDLLAPHEAKDRPISAGALRRVLMQLHDQVQQARQMAEALRNTPQF
ncbi:hypothetical protein [Paucibacter sp. B51]|uniref:hypothetical protein n=1 Tax=Paucibacter sp. B51 TaxID=2993315 RepID=UPI0022EBF11D|nr:hypothetical protein [Paucibacter sp. B51]